MPMRSKLSSCPQCSFLRTITSFLMLSATSLVVNSSKSTNLIPVTRNTFHHAFSFQQARNRQENHEIIIFSYNSYYPDLYLLARFQRGKGIMTAKRLREGEGQNNPSGTWIESGLIGERKGTGNWLTGNGNGDWMEGEQNRDWCWHFNWKLTETAGRIRSISPVIVNQLFISSIWQASELQEGLLTLKTRQVAVF